MRIYPTGTWRSLRDSIGLVMSCSLAFFAVLLFDMVGDKSGWFVAMWVPGAALLIRLVIAVGSVTFFRSETG